MSEKQSSPSAKGLLRGGGRSVPEVLKPLVFPNHQGLFRIFTTVVTAAVTYYMVFHHNFGEKRHCFSWLRELKEQKKREFFHIDSDDRELQKMREKVHGAQEEGHRSDAAKGYGPDVAKGYGPDVAKELR